MYRLSVVGGGRMGEALLSGLLGSGWAEPGELAVVEVVEARRQELSATIPGVTVVAEVPTCDGAVIAVKPGDAEAAVRAAVRAGAGRLLSIAAGVSLRSLEAAAEGRAAVVRAMPNTPALVGLGASAISGGEGTSEEVLGWAESILSSVGTVVRLPEGQLDAVTGLSGSGPAYLFLVAEALTEAGVLVGLRREVAADLVRQTLLGAATLLSSSGEPPTALREAVTSPGGTTAEGLRVLEAAGVRAAFIEAVVAAAERSRSLGRTAPG